jgi:hypothetical protein
LAEDAEKTVVLGFAAKRGVDQELADALTEVILGPYSVARGSTVISRADLAKLVDLEAQKQAMGCDDGSCMSELAAALDANRVVSGTITKVGSAFLMVLNEYDAKEVKSLGRVQETVEGDEAKLVEVAQRLAEQLVGAAPTAAVGGITGGATAAAGSIEIRTTPSSAEVFLAGEAKGMTPVRIDNLRVGNLPLKIIRKDYSTVETTVPVFAGKMTRVEGELRLDRELAEANHKVHLSRWEEEKTNHYIWLYTKAGVGVVMATAGTVSFVSSFRPNLPQGERQPLFVSGLIVGGIGYGLGLWAAADLALVPEEPVPEWDQERKLEIIPPKDVEAEVVEVTLEASPAVER